MKLGKKLIISMIALNLVGFAILITVSLRISQQEITSLITDDATRIAREGGYQVKFWLDAYMDTVRTLAQIFEQYETLPASTQRDTFNMHLKTILAANTEMLAIWTCWETNVLDGLDAEYANTEGADITGRYIPYFFRIEDAVYIIAVTPLEEIAKL